MRLGTEPELRAAAAAYIARRREKLTFYAILADQEAADRIIAAVDAAGLETVAPRSAYAALAHNMLTNGGYSEGDILAAIKRRKHLSVVFGQ